MIRKLEKSNRVSRVFSVCDIENRSNGKVLAIDTYDGTTHKVHFDWGSWIEFLRRESRNNKRLRTIYAHNGGGWDWLSLLEWLIPNNPDMKFDTISNGGKIVCVTLEISTRCKIKLCDSLFLLKTSLENAGMKYCGKGKVKHDKLPEWYWDNDREAFWKYLYGDTELLFEVMNSFATLIYSKIAPIGKLSLTLPATTLKAFQTEYLEKDIGTPEDDKVKQLLRAAYAGGRVEAFKPGYHRNIWVYDFNSLYPSVMYDTPVPTTGKVIHTSKFIEGKPGIYYVTFRQDNRRLYPLLMVNGNGAYSGSGWYYENEIRRFVRRHHTFGKIDIHRGIIFPESEVIFKRFVDTLYSLRMTDRNGPLGEVCKLCMNSLYGKFAQKPVRVKTAHLDYDTVEKHRLAGDKVEILSAEYGIYRISRESELGFEHVAISGTITSEARARLWEAFNTGTVYCDTDSIHTTNELLNHDNNGLGKLKLEFHGEGVYLGKKLYALRNDKTEKVKAKGIRVGGNLGCNLDFETLQELSRRDTLRVACTFESAATASKVIAGKKACTFSPTTRRIRVTNGQNRGNRI